LNDLRTSFAAHPADVVLMHFGTNDVWNNVAPQTILNAYSTMIDALRVANPNVVVLVAQIIAMNPINTPACPTCACPACSGRVTTLDGMIPAWAATKTTAASPVRVVDQLTGFNTATDTADGVHPNSTTGAPKIAAKWYAALAPLF
jgi:mannan endo-1,4-beta-mannosidase